MHALYTLTLYAITVVARPSTGVVSTCGVKQGCPLSPTLFGLCWTACAGGFWNGPRGRTSASLWQPRGRPMGTLPAHQRLLDTAHAFLPVRPWSSVLTRPDVPGQPLPAPSSAPATAASGKSPGDFAGGA